MGGEQAAVGEAADQPRRLDRAQLGEDPELLEVRLDGELGLVAGGVAGGGDEAQIHAPPGGVGTAGAPMAGGAATVAGPVEDPVGERL